MDKSTFIHEFGHQNHVRELQDRFGVGTAAFNRQFNDARDWADDEVNAYNRDIDFCTWAMGILDNICPATTAAPAATTQQAQPQP